MNLLYIFVFINLIKNIVGLYLNNNQIISINNLIKNNKLNHFERNKINLILYKAFEGYAIKKAFDFKYIYNCLNISNGELIFYSKIGLFKSTQKYNGKHSFIKYSTIYIYSELYRLIKEKYILSNKNKHNKLFVNFENWQINNIYFNENNEINRIIDKYNNYDEINNLIDKQNPFTKRIIYLKYFLKPNEILSNKHVSELMCCSEETIRKQLLQIKT